MIASLQVNLVGQRLRYAGAGALCVVAIDPPLSPDALLEARRSLVGLGFSEPIPTLYVGDPDDPDSPDKPRGPQAWAFADSRVEQDLLDASMHFCLSLLSRPEVEILVIQSSDGEVRILRQGAAPILPPHGS